LKTNKDIADYLEAVFEDGDPALVAAALGDVARAKGMSQIAQAAGLGRESYKALSTEGNPEACSTTFFMCLPTAVSAMLLPRSLFFTIDAI
jgi:probable addiction module antidote protein